MNFLAHFFLAQEQETWIVGNFLADYLRKPAVSQLPAAIQEGVALHVEIDRLTDHHPVVRQVVQRLIPHHSKYSGVVLDVLCDYFLIKHWEEYTTEPFEVFTDRIYGVLQQYQAVMPEGIRTRLPNMIQGKWLHSYGHTEGLDFTFQRLQSRMSKPALINDVLSTHQTHYELLDVAFNAFFPEIREALQPWKNETILQNGWRS